MKKATLLLAALALPMLLSAQMLKSNVGTLNRASFKNSCRVGVSTATPHSILELRKVTRAAEELPEGMAQIKLTADDVWGDGSGYQLLLDADATAYGTTIPETGGLTTSGNASDAVYAEFEYKIPENADGALTTSNVLIAATGSVNVPAGTYDYCITNPTPGDRVWIASSNGPTPGRGDDIVFEAGMVYEFCVTMGGQNDAVELLTYAYGSEPLLAPKSVAVSDITRHEATVSWNSEEALWNVRLSSPGNLLWTVDDENFDGWSYWNVDGDGYSWSIYTMDEVGHESPMFFGVGSEGSNNDWLFLPACTITGNLKLWARAYLSSANFDVMITTNPSESVDEAALAEFVTVAENITVGTEYVEIEADLSEYIGQMCRLAIRAHDFGASGEEGYDYLCIDDISIVNPDGVDVDELIEGVTENPLTLEGLEPGRTYTVYVQAVRGEDVSAWSEPVSFTTLLNPTPVNLAAVPAANTAEISWDVNDASSYNLRYREFVPKDTWTFDEDEDGWSIIDADGNGNCWQWNEAGYMTSASWASGWGAMTPDNWLVSPAVELGGTLSFDAWPTSTYYYGEVFAVYVCTGDPSDVNNFVAISDDITLSTSVMNYEFDLSEYEGLGYVAIRHYNCTDNWSICIDNIHVDQPTAGQQNEWIEVNGITESPYTLTGLNPETTYEVQVQAVYGEAKADEVVSDWTKSVVFTTTEGEAEAVYYVLGFNDWQNAQELGEEGVTVDVQAQDFDNPEDTAQEFKIVTPAEDGGWIWYGGIDENGVGYFLLGEDLMGVNITLDDAGKNFRLAEPGNYTIKLVKEAGKAPVEGVKIVVTKNTISGIETVKSENNGDNNYYNLMGQKFNGSNLPAGIYIHNGKKIVVK